MRGCEPDEMRGHVWRWAAHGLAVVLFACVFLLPPRVLQADADGDLRAMAAGKRAVVLLFVASDCPISNAYAPEIERIYTRYAPRKIAITLVYIDPDLTRAAARRHAASYGYTCPLLLDPAHRLAQRAGATVTPEAAVFRPDGRLLYRGRIDDTYFGYGKRRSTATRHDLRDALDAVLSGRQIRPQTTPAIGCFI